MDISFPTNRPFRIDTVRVNKIQFEHIFTAAAAAMGKNIASNLAKLKDAIAPACDKTFVMMKNKQVWFDRNNAALFPKFEAVTLPSVTMDSNRAHNYPGLDFEGFHFVTLSGKEFQRSFTLGTGCPYLNSNGSYKHLPGNLNWSSYIATDEISGSATIIRRSNGSDISWESGSSYRAAIIPIHRLRGKDAAAMSYFDSFITWIKLKLIPEGLKPKQERFYKSLLDDYDKIEEYLTIGGDTITFDSAKFTADVLAGRFIQKVFGYDFDIRGTLSAVMSGERKFTGSVEALKAELLHCDEKRANIQPYEERQLTDVNRGHWELFEHDAEAKDEAPVTLPKGEILVARPPQLDVRLNATCAIDFGTKSTVVVCRDGEARMLRIGKGDYSKTPTRQDFENPTALELRDVQKFLAAYRARIGRPFTEWEQVTASHQAAEAIFKADLANSSVYNSVFSELKQWAKDEKNYPVLKDLQGFSQEVQPYVETKALDDGGFDPIEIYAYYLGLYINNMHHQIYLDYILSYPVNYKKDVREKIRASFERGIKKSLPPALLQDEEIMRRFRVYLGASEPAAYAISALEGFKLQPKVAGEKVAYGVFDFGGGTTDFDFGIEYVPENHRRNFEIEQFGFNGDVLLGGENIIELLAYEVYKDNLAEMRAKKIPFALPAGCEIFAGAETLVSRTRDSAAHMNNRLLAEKLRPLWENPKTAEEMSSDMKPVLLFSSDKKTDRGKNSIKLRINVEKLQNFLEARIRQGVVNFFQSLHSAFDGKNIYPIHILLAGNSCKSPLVKKIFEELIEQESAKIQKDAESDGEFFKLHMPLGMEDDATENPAPPAEIDLNLVGKDDATENPADNTYELYSGKDDATEILTVEVDTENPAPPFEFVFNLGGKDDAIVFGGKDDTIVFGGKDDAIVFGGKDDATENPADDTATENPAPPAEIDLNIDRQLTGKTGVAFGLLRCRRGAKDVKIINRNVDESGEINFPYYLGDAGTDGNTFTVKIGRDIGYGIWTYFTVADEPEFELYYTTAPRALQGNMPVEQVSMIRCLLDDGEVTDDENFGVYIRKSKTNEIEYAVGRAENFVSGDFHGKVYRQIL